jgi:hypothetical protein
MIRHRQLSKQIIKQINVWITTGIIVLIFIVTASVNWAQGDPGIVAWLLMIAGVAGVLGWWVWSIIIIYLLIMQRIREHHLIKNVVDEIKEIKADIKNKLFK